MDRTKSRRVMSPRSAVAIVLRTLLPRGFRLLDGRSIIIKCLLGNCGTACRFCNSERVWEDMESKYIPGIRQVNLTTLLRDGSAESEKLKLRQSGDQWLIYPSEEAMGFGFTSVDERLTQLRTVQQVAADVSPHGAIPHQRA